MKAPLHIAREQRAELPNSRVEEYLGTRTYPSAISIKSQLESMCPETCCARGFGSSEGINSRQLPRQKRQGTHGAMQSAHATAVEDADVRLGLRRASPRRNAETMPLKTNWPKHVKARLWEDSPEAQQGQVFGRAATRISRNSELAPPSTAARKGVRPALRQAGRVGLALDVPS